MSSLSAHECLNVLAIVSAMDKDCRVFVMSQNVIIRIDLDRG